MGQCQSVGRLGLGSGPHVMGWLESGPQVVGRLVPVLKFLL